MDINSPLYRKAFIKYLRKGIHPEITFKEDAKNKRKYIWRTQGDDKVRPSHEEREGKIFEYGVGIEPGDEPGCRCWAEPYYGENGKEKYRDSILSLKKQIANHELKLAEYIKDPYKSDNKDFLKNAPNNEVRQKIIKSRIKHLKQEIKTFQDNIQKIKNGQ